MKALSRDFGVEGTCALMEVSRSGYYRWLNSSPSQQANTRADVVEAVRKTREDHPTHGYRWVAAYVRQTLAMKASNNFIYKCFQYLDIKAETRHKPHSKVRRVKDKFPNLIYSTWETVDRPRQVIVSDMTAFRLPTAYYEVTFYFDVFTKEILSWRLAERRGDRMQYIDGLRDVVELLDGAAEPAILHTDQGSVYASMAYNDLIRDKIIRSMSRAGKPTDNPVNEALNGWVKEELMLDFHMARCNSRSQVADLLRRYVTFYNEQRPCFAIGYDIPARYRKRYEDGELPRRETFASRELSEVPKFVREKVKKCDTTEAEGLIGDDGLLKAKADA